MGLIDWVLKKSRLLKREFSKIKKSFEERDKIISEKANMHEHELLKQELNNKISKKEVEEMIKLAINEVRAELREPAPRTKLKSDEKKVLKKLDTLKLANAIASCIKQGYSTTQAKDEIMQRFEIKKTCFFEHYRLVRDKMRGLAPRTKQVAD